MSVHYKFKSGKEAHTITFDSLHISVGELKKSIMQQRKIGKSADLDLQITNAQTKEVYESDSVLIPKNTSVIVARVPVANSKKSWNKSDKSNDNNLYGVEEKTLKTNNLAGEGTEDDKIKEMLTQSTKDYDPSKYARGKGPMGPLPPNYTCYRCGKPGHYIKHCPTNNTDVKRSTGIPRSFMIPAKADQKGAMITASGEYAVPIIDHDAYREVKKEKPPFFSTESEPEAPKIQVPDDLKCSLCNNLLQDAVLIPCCGNSFCDECIRSLLLDSDNHQCPSCEDVGVSPDTLIPNRFLRLSVAKFKNETGAGIRIAAEENKDEKEKEAKPESAEKPADTNESEKVIAEEANGDAPVAEAADQSQIKLEEVNQNDGEPSLQNSNEVDAAKPSSPKKDGSSPKKEDSELSKDLVDDKATNGHIEPTNLESSNTSAANDSASTASTAPPLMNPIHALQPPYAMSLNNNGIGRYRQNQIRVRSSGQGNMFARIPGQMMPRNNFSQNRTLLPNESAFFNDQMPPFAQVGMPMPYGGYGAQMHGPTFENNMFNINPRGGPMNPLLPFGNCMNLAAFGGLPLMNGDGPFVPPVNNKYHDYEDRLERFNRHLESRSRGENRRRYSRERSPSRRERSKSRSGSYFSNSSYGKSNDRGHREREHHRERSSHKESRDKSESSSSKSKSRDNKRDKERVKERERERDKERDDRSSRSHRRSRSRSGSVARKKIKPDPPAAAASTTTSSTDGNLHENSPTPPPPPPPPTNKSEEIKMEIKIQEDYSDLENEEMTRGKDVAKEANGDKDGPKSNDRGHREREHHRERSSQKEPREKSESGSSKSKSKDKKRDKEKVKEREREHHRERSSQKEPREKSESSSSKSKSRDKKRDKERVQERERERDKERDDRSSRSHRRSRSRSGSVARKKIKSQIDVTSSKHKSSKSRK